jgi:uncharacterized protein YqfA (UPF0365 family)
MTLRRSSPGRIVGVHIRLAKAERGIDINLIEAHHLAGGDIQRVAEWLIAADAAGVEVSWQKLTKLDLERELPPIEDVSRDHRQRLIEKVRNELGDG